MSGSRGARRTRRPPDRSGRKPRPIFRSKPGFSLVTGAGRAEIEFEDASTAYLGENSVLVFETLTTTGGVPRTEISLVSGTLSLHAHPEFPGEIFAVRTPADGISLRYPDLTYLRLNSYLDALLVTPQEASTIHLANLALRTPGERTFAYRAGHPVPVGTMANLTEMAEWDSWVADRVASRNIAMAAAMKQSGLSAPIPGLADLTAQGTFTPCAPYGTCWEPNRGWGAATRADAPEPYVAPQLDATSGSQSAPSVVAYAPQAGPGSGSAAAGPLLFTEDADLFPCAPDRLRYLAELDPLTGRRRILNSYLTDDIFPYRWAVCHTGSWIYRQNRYLWVAGSKRHHNGPYRWVKVGRTIGFVPVHPIDVAGKLPNNLKHGVFALSGHRDEPPHHIALDIARAAEVAAIPKELRKPYVMPLQRAEAPQAQAHVLKDLSFASNASARPAGSPIAFDHKSQSFLIARQLGQGSGATTVMERFGGRGETARQESASGGAMRGSDGIGPPAPTTTLLAIVRRPQTHRATSTLPPHRTAGAAQAVWPPTRASARLLAEVRQRRPQRPLPLEARTSKPWLPRAGIHPDLKTSGIHQAVLPSPYPRASSHVYWTPPCASPRCSSRS